MILGWLDAAKNNRIIADNHKTNRMQGSNHLWNSRIVRLYLINLVRQRRMQHAQQSICNLPMLCWCAVVTRWPKNNNGSDNH